MNKKITGTGDDGFTDILGKGRVSKFDQRIETLGTIDEATSALGLARAQCNEQTSQILIERIQHTLYRIMAEIASTLENVDKFRSINQDEVDWLDEVIQKYIENREPLRHFIIPGDTPYSAALDLARVHVRRAERRFVEFMDRGGSNNLVILRYLNRLSSLIFEMELAAIFSSGKNKPTLAKK